MQLTATDWYFLVTAVIPKLLYSTTVAGVLSHNSVRGRPRSTPEPGLTRQNHGFQVAEKPPTYLVDTPGVLTPKFETDTDALKLSVGRCVKHSVCGDRDTSRYLLAFLCQPGNMPKFAKVVNAITVDSAFNVRKVGGALALIVLVGGCEIGQVQFAWWNLAFFMDTIIF